MSKDPYAYLIDPDNWSTTRCEGIRLVERGPGIGEVVGYRYSAWRVTDLRRWDGEQTRVGRGTRHPHDLELIHLVGPKIDGLDRVVVQGHGMLWMWLGERFRTCSCHGHPWPCLDYDRDILTRTLAVKAARELAGAAPGVCAACREAVTNRQQRIVFPEPSLIVPGAPGPTFHARRSSCWLKASEYECNRRLPAYPEVDRLASCPGAGFTHEVGLRFECTAGPGCTGQHGPWRKDQGNCATRTYRIEDLNHYDRPLSDCGFRASWGTCLGAEVGPCRPSGLEGVLGG